MDDHANLDQNPNNTQTKAEGGADSSTGAPENYSQHQSTLPSGDDQETARIEIEIPAWLKKISRRAWAKACEATLADWIIAAATVAIFVTSYLQWTAIRGQLRTMNVQLKVARQQLIGAEAAVVQPGLDWYPMSGVNTLQIAWKNSGRVVATNIRAQLQLKKTALPSESDVWKSHVFVSSLPNLIPGDNRNTTTRYPFTISDRELGLINNTELTVTIDGSLEYFNGFEKVEEPLCFSLLAASYATRTGQNRLGPNLVRCEDFHSELADVLEEKKNALFDLQEQKQKPK